jgi:hypothetical protein
MVSRKKKVIGEIPNEVLHVIYYEGKRCPTPFKTVTLRLAYNDIGPANAIITKLVNSMVDDHLRDNYKEDEWYLAPKKLKDKLEKEFRNKFEVRPYGPLKV